MSAAIVAIAGSVFPAFFQCTAIPIMPLHDPVEDVRFIAADGEFAFDQRFAAVINVASAKGEWTGESWAMRADSDRGGRFEASLAPSDDDELHWGLDWRVTDAAAGSIDSSGIADCRLLDPATMDRNQ